MPKLLHADRDSTRPPESSSFPGFGASIRGYQQAVIRASKILFPDLPTAKDQF